jgi:hypothetical protein
LRTRVRFPPPPLPIDDFDRIAFSDRVGEPTPAKAGIGDERKETVRQRATMGFGSAGELPRMLYTASNRRVHPILCCEL